MNDTVLDSVDISKAFREDLDKDIEVMHELSYLLTPKGIPLKKIKEMILKSYGMNDLNKKDLEELPSYSLLSVQQQIAFSRHQRRILASCLTAELGVDIESDDVRLKDIFIPEKTLIHEIEKYANSGFLKKMSFNKKSFYKKQGIDELNPYLVNKDLKGKPIFSDYNQFIHLATIGNIEDSKQHQSSILRQHIENDSPFILLREGTIDDEYSDEGLLELRELYNYQPKMEFYENNYPIDLLNLNNLSSLFEGTRLYKKKINDVSFTTTLNLLLRIFIIIQKSKFKFMFNKNEFFNDLMNFDKLVVNAKNHIYNLQEHVFFEIAKLKTNEDGKNIMDLYSSISDEFIHMVKEVITAKDLIEHISDFNLYDLMDNETNADNKSFIFGFSSNPILKSLMSGLINDVKISKTPSLKMIIVEESFEEMNLSNLIKSGRGYHISVCYNGNGVLSRNEQEKTLDYFDNTKYISFYYDERLVEAYKEQLMFSKELVVGFGLNSSFSFTKGDKKPISI
jgi:hypothetical protein